MFIFGYYSSKSFNYVYNISFSKFTVFQKSRSINNISTSYVLYLEESFINVILHTTEYTRVIIYTIFTTFIDLIMYIFDGV